LLSTQLVRDTYRCSFISFWRDFIFGVKWKTDVNNIWIRRNVSQF